ncbi:glycosyltransferase family 2 protein [Phocaeicola sp.]
MKVSIIMPCYNQGRYLQEAIDSVLEQSFQDWECVIINDGSTDNSEYIAKKICLGDDRIRYVYQHNQGVCVARNNAIKASKGEYVLCLDGDDKISSNYLATMCKVLDDNLDVKVVTSTVRQFGKIHRTMPYQEFSLERLMGRNIFVISSMFRRSDFDSIYGFNENMSKGLEDWDFWLSLLENGGKVVHCPNSIFYYRIRSNSRNNSIKSNDFVDLRRTVYKNHEQLYSSHFFNPIESFEYELIVKSLEYKIGRFLLNPIRALYNKL